MSAPTASPHTRVGAAPPGYNQGWVTHTVHFNGFASLSTVRGQFVKSPEFLLLGNQWRLVIYPGGYTTAAEGMVSIFLYNKSDKAIGIEYGFSVVDGKQKEDLRNFGPFRATFASRSDLLSSLVDGTLVIEVRMKTAKPMKSVPPPFIPENPFGEQMRHLFLNDDYAVIKFEVGGEEQPKNSAMKVAKTAPVTLRVHRFIIEKCTTGILSDICRSSDGTPPIIQITDVSSDVFRLLLFYMYGGKLSDDDMNSHAKELVDAADRFGVVSLKIEAEVYIVGATTFTMENVMELLLYAESKNCALLKEAALDFLVDNKADVIEKLITNDLIPASLIKDLFVPVLRGEKKDGIVGDIKSELADMRINELRRMAHEKCLNVDESREMLIAALKSVQEAVVAQDFLTE